MSKLILGTSNADYHGNSTHLSSSSLKMLLKSAQQFEHEYILGHKENVERDVFVEGSLTHVLILEPEKLTDYAIYPGLRKGGKVYEAFKELHKDKVIVSAAQMLRCQKLVTAYQSLPVALDIMSDILPEHNMVSSVLGIPVKARADAISLERRAIIDVKTTAMPSGADIFRQTINDYMYHLSAALYCQIAYNNYGNLFDFYWLVLSKADNQCHVYKASSETLSMGNALVTQAIVKYKKCKEAGIWLDGDMKTSYDSTDYEIEEV